MNELQKMKSNCESRKRGSTQQLISSCQHLLGAVAEKISRAFNMSKPNQAAINQKLPCELLEVVLSFVDVSVHFPPCSSQPLYTPVTSIVIRDVWQLRWICRLWNAIVLRSMKLQLHCGFDNKMRGSECRAATFLKERKFRELYLDRDSAKHVQALEQLRNSELTDCINKVQINLRLSNTSDSLAPQLMDVLSDLLSPKPQLISLKLNVTRFDFNPLIRDPRVDFLDRYPYAVLESFAIRAPTRIPASSLGNQTNLRALTNYFLTRYQSTLTHLEFNVFWLADAIAALPAEWRCDSVTSLQLRLEPLMADFTGDYSSSKDFETFAKALAPFCQLKHLSLANTVYPIDFGMLETLACLNSFEMRVVDSLHSKLDFFAHSRMDVILPRVTTLFLDLFSVDNAFFSFFPKTPEKFAKFLRMFPAVESLRVFRPRHSLFIAMRQIVNAARPCRANYVVPLHKLSSLLFEFCPCKPKPASKYITVTDVTELLLNLGFVAKNLKKLTLTADLPVCGDESPSWNWEWPGWAPSGDLTIFDGLPRFIEEIQLTNILTPFEGVLVKHRRQPNKWKLRVGEELSDKRGVEIYKNWIKRVLVKLNDLPSLRLFRSSSFAASWCFVEQLYERWNAADVNALQHLDLPFLRRVHLTSKALLASNKRTCHNFDFDRYDFYASYTFRFTLENSVNINGQVQKLPPKTAIIELKCYD